MPGSPVLVARKRRDGEWNVYEKSRKSTTKVKSIWSDTDFINEQGTVELGRLGMGDVFDHPKPVALLQRCIYMATGPDDLVMDVFAGSGTMGHAALAQNASRRRESPVCFLFSFQSHSTPIEA
jgi:adenine-specific DNA-methyltransferase